MCIRKCVKEPFVQSWASCLKSVSKREIVICGKVDQVVHFAPMLTGSMCLYFIWKTPLNMLKANSLIGSFMLLSSYIFWKTLELESKTVLLPSYTVTYCFTGLNTNAIHCFYQLTCFSN